MALLGVLFGAETAERLRLLRGQMALAGFALASALLMVQSATVGFLEASVMRMVSWCFVAYMISCMVHVAVS